MPLAQLTTMEAELLQAIRMAPVGTTIYFKVSRPKKKARRNQQRANRPSSYVESKERQSRRQQR